MDWRSLDQDDKKGFFQCASATALIEFSLFLPVILLILCSTFEICRYLEFKRHMSAFANAVAQQYSSINTPVVWYDLWNSGDLVLWTTPEYTAMRYNQGFNNSTDTGRGIQITSVSFQPSVAGCTTGCTYTTGKVMWYFSWGIGNQRQCGMTQTPVTVPTSTPDNTIPSSYFNKGGLIIADVKLTYTPLFSKVIPTSTLYATAYALPMFYNDTYLPSSNAGVICP